MKKKPYFWIVDFERQVLQWTPHVGEMMTFATWQFVHMFWNGGVVKITDNKDAVVRLGKPP
jgi:hypothetical protein